MSQWDAGQHDELLQLPTSETGPHAQGLTPVGQHVAGSVVGSANVSVDVYELRTGPTSVSPHPVAAEYKGR